MEIYDVSLNVSARVQLASFRKNWRFDPGERGHIHRSARLGLVKAAEEAAALAAKVENAVEEGLGMSLAQHFGEVRCA
ncbi:hypothetical protein ABIE30_000885 [Janthinobacterium lividum]